MIYTIFHLLHHSNSLIRLIYDRLKYKYQLIFVHKLPIGSIFIADSAQIKVLKDKYFNKRHKNSY